MEDSSLVVDLALVLGVAALTSPFARALGQSTVLGYLIAGLILGPYIPIPLFANAHRVESLAELGVVLVMFAVGLELRLTKLVRVLPTAGLTGALQLAFMMWCGHTLATSIGWTSMEGIFLGAGLSFSSTMVVSRALPANMEGEVRTHILGVLVVQDVLAIILLAVMTGVAASGRVETAMVTADVMRLAGVLLAMIVLGLLLVPRLVRAVARLASDEVLTVVAVGVCFVLAATAVELGYSAALGAFVSGVLVAESGLGRRVEHLAASMRDVFAGIFFVSIGMTVDPMGAVRELPLALAVMLLVILGQLSIVTVAGLVSGLGLRRSVTAGVALGQIGEFSFILASVGISAHVARPDLQALLVTVAVLTAFTTPIAIRNAPRVVSWADRAMPAPIRRTLSLHEQWVLALRSGDHSSARRDRMRRALRALAVDGALLFGLALMTARLADAVVRLLHELTGLSRSILLLAWFAFCLFALAAPVFLVAFRNTSALARAMLMSSEATDAPSMARVRALRALLLLGFTALVGFPSATVVNAFLADGRIVVLVVVALIIIAVIGIRSARDVDAEVRSAALRIAVALTSQGADASAETSAEATERPARPTLPELGVTERLTVTAGCHASGKTLAELDLRAHTGATVLTIQREGGSMALPNGQDRLREGDVLLLAGTNEALEAARALLLDTKAPAPDALAPST